LVVKSSLTSLKEFPTSFPGIELYPSSTESSETDFHMSRGLFPSTNFNNLDSSEGSDAVFEAITQEADKTKEERKLAVSATHIMIQEQLT
jgi:hypothetical protein